MTAKVLLVGDSSSRHLERLASGLAERGIAASVAAFEPRELALPVELVGRLPADADRRYALAVLPLVRLIRRVRPTVVHAHYLSSYGVLAAAATRLLGILQARSHALVQSVWGSDVLVTPHQSGRRARLARFALEAADMVTGDSDELREASQALARKELSWHEFIFGPPAELFGTVRSSTGMSVVSPRSLLDAMRIEIVIEAFLAARKTPHLANATLDIFGDGDAGERLRMMYGSTPGVRFRGAVTTQELHDAFGTSRAFVSIPVSDGTSASVLEGMALGCIPIVNALPANLQWVDGTTGIIVGRDPSVPELAEALVRALSTSYDVGAMRAAVRRARWEDQVDRLVSMYDVLSARRSG